MRQRNKWDISQATLSRASLQYEQCGPYRIIVCTWPQPVFHLFIDLPRLETSIDRSRYAAIGWIGKGIKQITQTQLLEKGAQMTRIMIFLSVVVALAMWTMSATANPLNVYGTGPMSQDGISIPEHVDEIGEQAVFPVGEQLSSSWTESGYTPCSELTDNPLIANVAVSITNLTGRDWHDVWYVADQGTTLTNYDGYIGNVGQLNDQQQAFKIDSVGLNTPLISENITTDGIWQNGETWVFVIEDFVGANGGTAAPFGSLGIAGLSIENPSVSTGSILVPEPSTIVLALLGILGFGIISRRRWV
jgi:hypothetical protein